MAVSGRQTIIDVIETGNGILADYTPGYMALMLDETTVQYDIQMPVMSMAKTDPDSPNSVDQQQIFHLNSVYVNRVNFIAFVIPKGDVARSGRPVWELYGHNITSAVHIKERTKTSLFPKRTYVLFAGKYYVEVDERINTWNINFFDIKNLTELLCSEDTIPDSSPEDPPVPPNVKPNPDSPPEETPGDSSTTTIVIIVILILIVALIVFVVLIVRNYIQKQRGVSNPNSDEGKTSTPVVQQTVQ